MTAIQGPRRISPAGDTGFVHIRARRLAMESVRVARAGNAVAQKPGVIGKTPVGLDDGPGRARRRKHALHGEFDAVERRAPNHLTHEWQRHDMTARIGQANGFDSGVKTEDTGMQRAIARGLSLLLAETLAPQGEMDGFAFSIHLASPPERASPPVPESASSEPVAASRLDATPAMQYRQGK